jgi:hypothetical protein
MISVVLYGRNDSHGYNLHKRAAISLNCIAEMLSAENDEVLFVDYNTPNDLPTFIEAIYDTLTTKTKRLLRVFRVRPELHSRIAGRTHLLALEPHARNIAIRRSNPLNRWILLTNTDMIFIPRSGDWTLSTAVEDLADGQYILPRFDLPEPLWELFSRTDPLAVMQSCRDLAWPLHLDEITVSHPYMRFDAPGDFQLVPRQTLFDINGFDERMIHGWHADSNMCKRLFLYYGNRTESLAHRLKGYHCDHTRVATATHRQDVKLENDLYEFVYLVKDPVAPGQKEAWGAPDVDVEQVDFSSGALARFIPALRKVLGEPQTQDYNSDSNDPRSYVCYSAEHVLPYVTGNLTVYPREARFIYAGNHQRMLELLTATVAELGFLNPLHYVPEILYPEVPVQGAIPVKCDNDQQLVSVFADYDLVLFDMGLDAGSSEASQAKPRVTNWPRAARYSIGRVARLIQTFAEHSEERWQSRKRIPEVLILNGNHNIFSSFIDRFLLTVNTPYTTRTRKGRPRVGSERLYRSSSWRDIENHFRAVFGYDAGLYPGSLVEPGTVIDFTTFGHPAPYQDGHWGRIDGWGCWTDGGWAEIVFRAAPADNQDLLVSLNLSGVFPGLSNESIRLVLSFEGERLGRSVLTPGYSQVSVRHLLPRRLMIGKQECRLRLEIENPQCVQDVIDATGKFRIGEDPEDLGVRLQSVRFASKESLKAVLGRIIDFTNKGTGDNHMTEFWTQPDNLGAWSLGPECYLVFLLEEQPTHGLIARFSITDAVVNETHPSLKVAVLVNGKEAAEWELGPYRAVGERSVFLGPDLITGPGAFTISFRIDSPRSPHELGWTEGDHRPLGFRLTRFQLDEPKIPRLKLGETIEFTAGSKGVEVLRGYWGIAEQNGSWTVGQQAGLQMQLEESPTGPVPAAFVVSDCMVGDRAPELSVSVKANGLQVANWTFGPERTPHVRKLEVPPNALSASGELALTFEIADPRTPHSFGGSDDQRPLGFKLARALFGSHEIEMPRVNEPPRRGLVQRLLNRAVKRLRWASGGSA